MAEEFLLWLCRTFPHQNHELRKLFPWLALVEEGRAAPLRLLQ